MGNLRPLTAEFIGTFGLVFVGAGAVVADTARSGALGLSGIAIAHGLVLAIMVSSLMAISGAHFNPAVTLALWLTNKLDVRQAGAYVVVQLLAGVLAAFLVMFLFPPLAGETAGYGVPRIAGDVTLVEAILIEAVLTFFLVSAVFGTAVSSEAPPVGGFAIGLVLVFAILVGGPMTGAALNPARALGPAVVASDWVGHITYWFGPLLGGAVAAFVWGKVLLPKADT